MTTYTEHRADGWPLCPRCGDDELYSLMVPATIETIAGCYACNWKRGGEEFAAAVTEHNGRVFSVHDVNCKRTPCSCEPLKLYRGQVLL